MIMKSKGKLISRPKNYNSYSAVENVTSPLTSISKAMAHCHTDNLPCEQEKLISHSKNANSYSAVENVTSTSASNFKALAPCQTDDLPCEQENKIVENLKSNINKEVGSPNSVIIGSSEDMSDPDSDHDYDIGEDLKQWLHELCAR